MSSRRIVVFTSLFLIARFYFAYQRAVTPFELDYEEGNVLNAAVRIIHGQTPYPPPGSFPYVFNPYGPIGYLTTAVAVRTFGLSLDGPRLFVLASGVAISLLIALLVWRITMRVYVGCLFGVLYICSPLAWRWLPLLRVDFWALLLSLAGIYFFVSRLRRPYLAAIFFSLAILTKPSAIAAPAACLLQLAIEKRKTDFAIFFLLSLALLGGSIWILGPDFRFALFQTHPDPYSFIRALRLYWVAVQAGVMPLAIIFLGLFSGFRWNSNSRIIWIYALTATLAALTAGKLGSETNHLLEWGAAICLLAALSLCHLLDSQNILSKPLVAAVLLLAGLFAFLPHRSMAIQPQQSQCPQVYSMINHFSGDRILSEDVAALVLARKPVIASNPFVITQLHDRVKWSQGTLEDLVRRRQFDLILLGGPTQNFEPESGRWSRTLIQNVEENYVLERTFACEPYLGAAYVPKPSKESGK